MKRTIALTQLVIISWMPIAPIFGPEAEASLPPCCRRHGKHHCIMQRLLALSGEPGGRPAVQEQCPCQPSGGGAVQSRIYAAAAPRPLCAGIVQPAPLPERIETPRPFAILDVHPQRGPPTSCV
jgi:hypothetical protein